MAEKKTPAPKPRGRPSTKIKLKHNPKSARQDFLKAYKDATDIGIYGVDDFAYEIINHLWTNPEISFHVTDSNPSRLSNANRYFGQRSFSMYRWEVYPETGFVEEPMCEVILASKDCYEAVMKRPNPYNVEIILLEEI